MDEKTQTDQQSGPMIATMKDGAGQTQAEVKDDGMLHLSVIAPEKTIFEGPIESMTSKNKNGPFDILPYHENFISLIEDKITIREKGKSPQDIPVGNAILKISKNQVEVYLGLEAVAEEATPAKTTSPASPQPTTAST